MAWQRTRRQHFDLTSGQVWSVVCDLRRWPEWCSAVRSASHAGPARSGSTAEYVPASRWAGPLHAATAPPLRIVEVQAPRRLVVEQPNPLGSMRVEWSVEPVGAEACVLTQRVRVTGGLTPLVVAGVAGALVREWPQSCTRLHGLASAGVAPLEARPRLKVVIAGGNGSLGRPLAADLTCRGHEVVVLTRRVDPTLPHRQVRWDGVQQGAWVDELRDPRRTAVVNLAGRLVDGRPTPAFVEDLRDSRVRPTRALVEASHGLTEPLAAWVQGSTTAIWSDAGERHVVESTPVPTGADALPQMTGVAQPWEAAAAGANTRRLTVLRTSIVLQTGSPALDRLTGLVRAGLGGRVASGRQWFSWVHLDDWLRIVRASLGVGDEHLPEGVVVAAAPHPARNAELMGAMRRRLRRPAAPPTPAILVRLGAVLLRTDPALGLTGRHCTSEVLAQSGFDFTHPTLDRALDDLLS